MESTRHSCSVLFTGYVALLCWIKPLHADVVITEFMAVNDTTLQDEDGETPDWIEIYNAATTSVNLGGWHLTDRTNDLTRWSFPATNLPPGGFVVVFASGKDRAVGGQELHTDFKLAGEGEYLALVKPDGVTISSELAPVFPVQYSDMSYGLSTTSSEVPLIGAGADCRVFVPTDSSLGVAWTARDGFDDSGWIEGPTGVGFDTLGEYAHLIGTDVQVQMLNVTPSAYIRIPFVVPGAVAVDSLELRMRFKDGFAAYINGQRVTQDNVAGALDWNSVATVPRGRDAVNTADAYLVSEAYSIVGAGVNMLAIHGVNDQVGGRVADFLIVPELMGLVPAFDLGGDRRYFTVPTPGRINTSGYKGVAGAAQFSHGSGTYTTPFDLVLTSPGSNAVIRYTLDQTAPDETSSTFTGQIPVSGTTLVRTRVFEPGYLPSPIQSAVFVFLDAGLQNFTSDIPIVVVDNLGSGDIPDAEPKQLAIMAILETENGVSALDGDVTLATRIAFRRRGETSLRPTDQKPNLAIESRGELGDDADIEPLGMPADSDWILHAPYSFDRALVRNAFIFELSNQLGAYACRTRFCEVFLNADGGALSASDYAGVYVFMERIKQGDDRVDIETLEIEDDEEPAICGGYIFKIDKPDPGKTAWSAGGQASMYYVYPREEEITTVQSTWLRGYVDDFGAALNGGNFTDPLLGYRPYFDTALSIDHHILNALPKNVDALRLSTFIHKPREGKMTFGPIWDFDRSMESTDGRDDAWNTWDAPNGTQFFDYGWWDRLFMDANFWQEWVDRWQALRDGKLSTTNMHAIIDSMAAELAQAQVRNFQKWTAVSPRTSWEWEVAHLKEWLALRASWIDAQLVDRPVLGRPGGSVPSGYALSITPPAGTSVYYTLDGSDPRAPGGAVAAGASLLVPGSSITVTQNVIVRARATDGSAFNSAPGDSPWSGMSEAIYSVREPTLAVTEAMYHPREPVGTERIGGYEARHYEFIEIQNVGPDRVELVGVRFTNGIAFDFTFSEVRSLEPGEFAVVVDEFAAFTNRYRNWGAMRIAGEFDLDLDDGGERVELLSATGRTLSSFRYKDARGWPLAADGAGHSLIPLRLFDQDAGVLDYGRHWRASAYIDGSPGAADPSLAATVVLNEFMAHTDYSGGQPWQDSDDWIELYNVSRVSVGLAEWYLSDDRYELTKWAIPAFHTVAAEGWIVFSEVQDFHTTQTDGFGLNKAGEEIYLSYLPAAGPGRVVDCVRFKGQENDVSIGCHPDGEEFRHALVPTEGTTNATPRRHVRIDELMYHPAPTVAHPENNTNDEYVEVHNPHPYAVSLWTDAGPWRIDGGVTFVFPSNTVLAAGERLLLVGFDPATNTAALAAFRDAYGNLPEGVVLLGPYDRSLDNIGERVAIEKPQLGDLAGEAPSWVIVDEVIYFDQSPWPSSADGLGDSLERTDEPGAGGDPDQWGAWAPSPGRNPAGIYLRGIIDRTAYFAPVAAEMIADVSGVSGDVVHADFYVGTNHLCRDTSAPFQCSLTSLTNAGTYACAAVVATGGGSYTSQTVRIDVLAFDTASVTAVSDLSATVNCRLRGSSTAYVQLHWGGSDGARDAGAWEHVQNVGSVSNSSFTVTLPGLNPGGNYYFRLFGSVGSESGWSPASGAFRARLLADWKARMKIRFGGYSGTSVLTNFPVLVRMGTHIEGFSYSDFGSESGHDLRFMDDTLQTALAYDIEDWDTNGVSCVWVQVPELRASGQIWAYWGAPGISSPPPYAVDGSTWSEGFRGVWHFHDDFLDAAGEGVTIDNFGSVAVDGIAGGGRSFDGTAAYAVPAIPANWYEEHLRGLTVSLWARPSAIQTGVAFGTMDGGGEGKLFAKGHVFRGQMYWRFGVDASELTTEQTSQVGAWQHVALVLGGGAPRGLYNGGGLVTGNSGGGYDLDGQPFLGARNIAGLATDFFSGRIDELRISEVPRSDDWVLAEYQTAAPNSAFASYEVVAARPVDRDGDGMPDVWEGVHFGGTNVVLGAPEADWDGDGASNQGEYVAGTDPTNAASCFRLVLEPSGSGRVQLSFESLEAVGDSYVGFVRYYDLQSAATLTNGAWRGVQGYLHIRGNGSTVVYTNTVGGGYFRGRTRLE